LLVRRKQPAVTTITFAFIAPMFLLLVFGLMEGCRVLSAWLVITNEAAEAARYGAVHYDTVQTTSAQANAVGLYISQRVGSVLPLHNLTPAPVVTIAGTPTLVDVT